MESWIPLFIVVALLVWFFLARMRAAKAPRPIQRLERASSPGAPAAHHWPALGDFDFEVVGESHYQQTIARFAGDHGTRSSSAECVASLVPEDDNRHDKSAVAVRIQGQLVGYLARDDARSFRRRLGQKGLAGAVTTCSACITGGGTRSSGEKLSYGVRLDIKPFDN